MASMNKTLYINDTALSDYGIYCSSDTYLNAPSIDYSEYQIPARTGTLIQYNKRLNNVLRVFSCICRKEDYVEATDKLKRLLYKNAGYVKLQSDYELEYYQYGYFTDELNFEIVSYEEVVMFELTFSCNPKKYKPIQQYSGQMIYGFDLVGTDSSHIQAIKETYREIIALEAESFFLRYKIIKTTENLTYGFGNTEIGYYEDDLTIRYFTDNSFPLFVVSAREGKEEEIFEIKNVENRFENITFQNVSTSTNETIYYLYTLLPINEFAGFQQYGGTLSPYDIEMINYEFNDYGKITNDYISGDFNLKIKFKLNENTYGEDTSRYYNIIIGESYRITIDRKKLFDDINYINLMKKYKYDDFVYVLFDTTNATAYLTEDYQESRRELLSFNNYVSMGGNIGIGADKIPLLVIFDEYDANPFFAIKDNDFFVDWWKL